MNKTMLKYMLLCMCIFLSLSVIEIFLLKPLFDFITTNYWGHFIIYLILLLIVNPLLTKTISDKFNLTIKITNEDEQ